MRKSVREVARLEEEALRQRRLMSRISDALTRATGSATSVALHGVGFAMWIGINTGLFTRIKPFDPFPFNFLTLVVSLEAIFLTLFVLISQNELTRLTDRRAHLDLQVNLLAERELTVMLKMLFGLSERQGLCDDELRAQVRELLEEPDLTALASDLTRSCRRRERVETVTAVHGLIESARARGRSGTAATDRRPQR